MDRAQRLKLLNQYVNRLNRSVEDLPLNEYRFVVSAVMLKGYETEFMFRDNLTCEEETLRVRWRPLRSNKGWYLYPPEIFDRFNKFVIERRAYK